MTEQVTPSRPRDEETGLHEQFHANSSVTVERVVGWSGKEWWSGGRELVSGRERERERERER